MWCFMIIDCDLELMVFGSLEITFCDLKRDTSSPKTL